MRPVLPVPGQDTGHSGHLTPGAGDTGHWQPVSLSHSWAGTRLSQQQHTGIISVQRQHQMFLIFCFVLCQLMMQPDSGLCLQHQLSNQTNNTQIITSLNIPSFILHLQRSKFIEA